MTKILPLVLICLGAAACVATPRPVVVQTPAPTVVVPPQQPTNTVVVPQAGPPVVCPSTALTCP